MSVAIIFIGTNKYLNFFPKYYETCEELLLPGVKKQYYVFTDGGIVGDEIPDHITAIKIPHRNAIHYIGTLPYYSVGRGTYSRT